LDNLSGIVPIFATICAIAIISSILLQLRGKELNKPLGDIIHFACYSVIVVIVMASVLELVKLTSSTLESLKNQMEIAFPLLLTLMAGLGASASVSIYQPVVAVLCGIMMQLFMNIVLPIFSLSIIFGVIGNMTSSVKLTKMAGFCKSLFKYVIGFTFTIFSGFLAVSGIMAGSYDSVSIRATKYAIKSYIPIMGGYLSDGFSLIMASSVLIKNAIGYSGLIIMFLTIISPLLKIVLFKLGLNLVAGIIEPVADSRVTNFVSETAKSMSMLSSIILAFSFAYLICAGLMMCTSNVIS
jgi:stage III sporulation protein AE